MKRLFYRLWRRLVGLLARPTLTGADHVPQDQIVIYVLYTRALSDLIVLDLVTDDQDIPNPLDPVGEGEHVEPSGFFPLMRASSGRITMRAQSDRMKRLIEWPDELKQRTVLIPTSVFWGRAMSGEGSWFRTATSEDWAVTGRFKRLLNLFTNRKNIMVHVGRPISLYEVCADADPSIALRRTARFLRVRLRQQKVRTLGPDFSHRRTLIEQVVRSRAVRRAVESRVASGMKPAKAQRQAEKYARTLASDMSHPTIRVLARLLRWFWNRIYDGIDLKGIERLDEISETHTLVYVPSHRSHLDYLLLSYLLYYQGYMIPHIAAGDNLNLPVVGSLLRRGGAFFMRRSFRNDALYVAVFEEYLYQVYRHGHCVEFFPEGGRTRTGRLLPAKYGLLKMTVAAQERGLPKPLAFVPVYFGYDKLVEGASYVAELRGANKKKESVFDVFRNINLIRQDFGRVVVNIGEPLPLDQWLPDNASSDDDGTVRRLASEIMARINDHAFVNPVNFVALTTLATPNQAIEHPRLVQQIECYRSLIEAARPDYDYELSAMSPEDMIDYTEALGLIDKEEHPFGFVYSHDPYAAVLMTWYRNNVVHTLALPSMVACLVIRRRHGIQAAHLNDLIRQIFPYLATELSVDLEMEALPRYLEIMRGLGLIRCEDGRISAPGADAPEQIQLVLLARLVMQTLERMYIVVRQLAEGPVERDQLQAASRLMAQKISRLYGINAPEFSDAKLFNQFIDGMIQRGAVKRDEAGLLQPTPVIENVLRAAEQVIEPQIRFGIAAAAQDT